MLKNLHIFTIFIFNLNDLQKNKIQPIQPIEPSEPKLDLFPKKRFEVQTIDLFFKMKF